VSLEYLDYAKHVRIEFMVLDVDSQELIMKYIVYFIVFMALIAIGVTFYEYIINILFSVMSL
jgi:hypothetical protein